MIGQRAVCASVAVFFVLILAISTAPVFENRLTTEESSTVSVLPTTEPINYDNDESADSDESTTVATSTDTTAVPEIETSILLFANFTSIIEDANEVGLNTTGLVAMDNQLDLPGSWKNDDHEWPTPYTTAN